MSKIDWALRRKSNSNWNASLVARFISLPLLFLTIACTVALEPAYDEKIVAELEALVAETQSLFANIPEGIPPQGYEERKNTYESLAARAATIKLYAEARPAPSGRLSNFFGNLFSPAPPNDVSVIGGDSDRASALSDADPYANATSGFMSDFLRNLKSLSDKDRENVAEVVGSLDNYEAAQAAYLSELERYRESYAAWIAGRGPRPDDLRSAPSAPTGSVSSNFVARRREVIEDILRDALFYERDILNRNR